MSHEFKDVSQPQLRFLNTLLFLLWRTNGKPPWETSSETPLLSLGLGVLWQRPALLHFVHAALVWPLRENPGRQSSIRPSTRCTNILFQCTCFSGSPALRQLSDVRRGRFCCTVVIVFYNTLDRAHTHKIHTGTHNTHNIRGKHLITLSAAACSVPTYRKSRDFTRKRKRKNLQL